MTLGSALLAAAVWSGSAHVDVMIWEPGGEHPYSTVFQLAYREEARVPILDSEGTLAGYSVRLVPQRIDLTVHHEVRHADGRPICSGGGREVVSGGPEARIVLPARGDTLASVLGFRVPDSGAYEIVLPRAVGAFACGDRKNTRDRWVVLGSGVFHPEGDVEVADTQVRALDSGGLTMAGAYTFTDAPRESPVRHDYSVRWELRKLP